MRLTLTSEHTKQYKKLWYQSIVTGETQKLHLPKDKVVDITPNTKPEEVGFSDIENLTDIVQFTSLIGNIQLLGYALQKRYRYLDEDAYNAFINLVDKGLILELRTPFPPVADLRVSDKSYVIWTEIIFDRDLVTNYISDQRERVEKEIGN